MEGTCTGLVVNTGDHTVMGRIASLTGNIKEEGVCGGGVGVFVMCMCVF